MLIGISPLLSPALLAALSAMGHADELVLADAHFPAESIARDSGATLIRADGIAVNDLLKVHPFGGGGGTKPRTSPSHRRASARFPDFSSPSPLLET